jgi:hypothetical protein
MPGGSVAYPSRCLTAATPFASVSSADLIADSPDLPGSHQDVRNQPAFRRLPKSNHRVTGGDSSRLPAFAPIWPAAKQGGAATLRPARRLSLAGLAFAE